MIPPNGQKEIEQLDQQIDQLSRQGQQRPALGLAARRSQLLKAELGEQSAPFATAIFRQAQLHRALAEDETARQLLQWVLLLRNQLSPQPGLEVAEVHLELGDLFRTGGNFSLAQQHLNQALTLRQARLGEADPAVAECLHYLARLALATGQYPAAEALFQQARHIHETTSGLDSPAYAGSLNDLADLYRTVGDFPQAQALYDQALHLRQSNLGENSLAVAETLDNLAELAHLRGAYDQALAHFEQSLDRKRALLGEQHPAILESLANLAALYQTISNFSQAESLFRQVYERRQKDLGEKHALFGQSVAALAGLYYELGRYDQAKSLQQWALQIRQSALGPEHPAVAESLDQLASTLQALGQYHLAEPRFDQALQIRRQAYGESHPQIAQSLQNLAHLYQTTGQYGQARAHLEQALAINRRLFQPQHPAVTTNLGHLGRLLFLMGDYGPAQTAFEAALADQRAALVETHPSIATTLHHLAELQATLGHYQAAQTGYEQALAIRRTSLGDHHPEVVAILNKLAELYAKQNDYANSLDVARQAHQIAQASLTEDRPEFFRSVSNLATAYHGQGLLEQANDLFRFAELLARQLFGPQHPEVAALLNRAAALDVAQNRPALALKKMQEAATIERGMIGQVFSIGSERQRLAYIRRITAAYHQFLALANQPSLAGSVEAVQAAFNLVLQRKGLGAEALAAQREAIWAGTEPARQRQLAQLTTLRQQIAQTTLAGPGSEPLQLYRERLNAWQAERERLEVTLAGQIPELALARKLQAADRASLAQALPAGANLVEFVRYLPVDFTAGPVEAPPAAHPARYLAFILPAGQAEAVGMIDLGEAGPIDQLIADFRGSITGEAERRSGDGVTRLGKPRLQAEPAQPASQPAGPALQQALLAPLTPFLAGKQLLIAPDGDLSRLPFEVLPGPAGPLLQSYQLSYLSTGRDVLAFAVGPGGQATDPCVIADPDFDLAEAGAQPQEPALRLTMRFDRLAGTRREGEQVGKLLGVTPWLADQALKGRLTGLTSPRILHIASHGFFLPGRAGPAPENGDRLSQLAGQVDNPLLRSGLALAGINTWNSKRELPAEAGNGLLTAEDVSGWDLRATELVVLSACETGLGQVEIGEGVLGLRRAFVLAGAKTLVMSLWQVPDQQTQQLMAKFYEQLGQGSAAAMALRTAQLALAKSWPNPFYWGAFICQGDPGR